jgi:hypothetical protein
MKLVPKGSRGFTLMELLVAAGLLALMGLILGTSISAVLGAIHDNREMQDRYHHARVALGRMQREIGMAYLSKHQGENKTSKTVFIGKPDRLMFTYMGHMKIARGSIESDQGVVEYLLEKDGDSDLPSLVRREKVIIDETPEKDGRRQVLAADVVKLRFEYWSVDKESWEGDWKVEIDNAIEEERRKAQQAAVATGMTGNVALGNAIAEQMHQKPKRGPDEYWLPARVKITMTLATDDPDQNLEFATQARIRILVPLNFQKPFVPSDFSDPRFQYGALPGTTNGAQASNINKFNEMENGAGN